VAETVSAPVEIAIDFSRCVGFGPSIDFNYNSRGVMEGTKRDAMDETWTAVSMAAHWWSWRPLQ
jgi:hypothetical protein